MIVNVPNGYWKVVEEGKKAVEEARLTRKAVENPYDDDDLEYDYWKLGAMAADHGWDIEW